MIKQWNNSEMEQFLTDFLNARGDAEAMAFRLLGEVLPDDRFFFWQRLLRQAWTEPAVTKDWIVFLIRSYLHKEQSWRALDPADAPELRTIPPPSIQTPFEQSALYITKQASRTRTCGNSECSRPYFFVSRRNQRYCSDECAKPSQQAAKRAWWSEHGERRRKAKQKD